MFFFPLKRKGSDLFLEFSLKWGTSAGLNRLSKHRGFQHVCLVLQAHDGRPLSVGVLEAST